MKHSTAPKVQLVRVAAIDRDTTSCPKAPYLTCVPFDPWAVDPNGNRIGDCVRCGQPAYIRAHASRTVRLVIADQTMREDTIGLWAGVA